MGVLGRLPSDFFVGEPGTTVKPAICFVRGLDSVDMAALYRFVVEESKLDVEVSEITDGGLLGVNGILDDMALGFDDGVAGVGGMADGRGTVAGSSAGSVCRGGVVEKERRENSCLKSLSLGKLNQTYPQRDEARDLARALYISAFSIFPRRLETWPLCCPPTWILFWL